MTSWTPPNLDLTGPIHDLAILCKNKFMESFPEIDCEIYESDAYRHMDGIFVPSYKVGLRAHKANHLSSELIVHFSEDHAIIRVTPSDAISSSCMTDLKEREVLYNNPKLMDILLSELKMRITAGEV